MFMFYYLGTNLGTNLRTNLGTNLGKFYQGVHYIRASILRFEVNQSYLF